MIRFLLSVLVLQLSISASDMNKSCNSNKTMAPIRNTLIRIENPKFSVNGTAVGTTKFADLGEPLRLQALRLGYDSSSTIRTKISNQGKILFVDCYSGDWLPVADANGDSITYLALPLYTDNSWKKMGKLSNDDNVSAVAAGNNLFVCVTKEGRIYNSSDCLKWKEALYNPQAEFSDVIYSNKIFLVISMRGGIYRSSDGIKWEHDTTDKTANLKAVCWGKDRFLSIGTSGSIYTSSDAIHWKRQTIQSGVDLKSIAFGNALFIAVGCSSNTQGSAGKIITSQDGEKWSIQTIDSAGNLTSVVFNGKYFVALGSRSLTSPDGNVWEMGPISASNFDVKKLLYLNNTFFACGARRSSDGNTFGLTSTSSNGKDWYYQSCCNDQLSTVAWSGTSFIAFGPAGGIFIQDPRIFKNQEQSSPWIKTVWDGDTRPDYQITKGGGYANNKVCISNPGNQSVKIGLRGVKHNATSENTGALADHPHLKWSFMSGEAGVNNALDFSVKPLSTASVYICTGRYAMFFEFSDEPGAVYQGDSVSLFVDEIFELNLNNPEGGNYKIKRIK